MWENDMIGPPSPNQQMSLIDIERDRPYNDFLCMLSKSWWYDWSQYVQDSTGEFAHMPKPIDNTELLDYDCELEILEDNEKCTCDDWHRMRLKSNLKEDHDFILVSENVWQLLHRWYSGGPKIKLPIIYKAESDSTGIVDLNPIVLLHQLDNFRSEVRGVLTSLQATVQQLIEVLAEVYGTSRISFSFYDEINARRTLDLNKDGEKRLEEIGITPATILLIPTSPDVEAELYDCKYQEVLERSLKQQHMEETKLEIVPKRNFARTAEEVCLEHTRMNDLEIFSMNTTLLNNESKDIMKKRIKIEDHIDIREYEYVVIPQREQKKSEEEIRKEFNEKYSRAAESMKATKILFKRQKLQDIVQVLEGVEKELIAKLNNKEKIYMRAL